MQISKENRKPVRAGFLCVGDVISYNDIANPYQEWVIVDTNPCEFWGRIAHIKSLTDGYEQTCFSPISFEKDGYAGWKFERGYKEQIGEIPASSSQLLKEGGKK